MFPSLSGCGARGATRSMVDDLTEPLYFSSARALAGAIRSRNITSEEIVRIFIERIEEVNPVLNAVVQLAADRAIARAREADAALTRGENWGPLHGVPMTIKDSFDTAGIISTGGTLGRASYVPESNATVVARLLNVGAILLGKTNTPEFTLSYETDNLVYGRTNNPYDLDRTPGGSSGGAAAIVAAGGSPFDIGTDLAGSIRLPSHFCGLAGIKPSAGRVPRTGHIYPFGGLLDTLQQVGPIARYVDDLAFILPLIMGPDWIDPGVMTQPWRKPRDVGLSSLRISFHTDNGIAKPTSEIIQTVQAVARSLESEVAAIEEVRPAGIEQTAEIAAVYDWDGGAELRRLLNSAGTTRHTLQDYTDLPPVGAVQLDIMIARWYEWRSMMLSFMKQYDAILCPVNALTAVPHGATSEPDALAGFSYTITYNLTGWPVTVVRAGTSSQGLPIGVQIVTAPGREDISLAIAEFVERTFAGFQRPTI
jgi:amidase